MRRKPFILLAFALAITAAADAQAVNLGPMRMLSAPGEPLRMKVAVELGAGDTLPLIAATASAEPVGGVSPEEVLTASVQQTPESGTTITIKAQRAIVASELLISVAVSAPSGIARATYDVPVRDPSKTIVLPQAVHRVGENTAAATESMNAPAPVLPPGASIDETGSIRLVLGCCAPGAGQVTYGAPEAQHETPAAAGQVAVDTPTVSLRLIPGAVATSGAAPGAAPAAAGGTAAPAQAVTQAEPRSAPAAQPASDRLVVSAARDPATAADADVVDTIARQKAEAEAQARIAELEKNVGELEKLAAGTASPIANAQAGDGTLPAPLSPAELQGRATPPPPSALALPLVAAALTGLGLGLLAWKG